MQITKRNLQLLDTPAKILHRDLFHHGIRKHSFDVVYSFGFIEHFSNPVPAIRKHLELLRRGGTLILVVPNIHPTLYGKIEQRISPDTLKGYRHISREALRVFMRTHGVRERFCDYVGVCNFSVVNAAALPLFFHRGYYVLAKLLNLIIIHGFRRHAESRQLSPYILYIGKT